MRAQHSFIPESAVSCNEVSARNKPDQKSVANRHWLLNTNSAQCYSLNDIPQKPEFALFYSSAEMSDEMHTNS